jgi:hypothetical protein
MQGTICRMQHLGQNNEFLVYEQVNLFRFAAKSKKWRNQIFWELMTKRYTNQ